MEGYFSDRNIKIGNTWLAICVLLLSFVAHTQANDIPNLDGLWKEGKFTYRIVHDDSGLSAYFENASGCHEAGDTAFWGSIRDGNKFTGTLQVCNPAECVEKDGWAKRVSTQIKFQISGDGRSFSGVWFWEQIDIYERSELFMKSKSGCENTNQGKWRGFNASRQSMGCGKIACYIEKATEQWRPMAGDDAVPLKIRASIEQPKDTDANFRFKLSEVTNETGFAMNAGTETGPDLEFSRDQIGFEAHRPDGSGYVIETNTAGRNAEVEVTSKDYGGWAKMYAYANVDGEWCTCKVRDENLSVITIPQDENVNHIADSWEKTRDVENQATDADEDTVRLAYAPNMTNKGDGFSKFEEYRGFMVLDGSNIKWTDTDPRDMDIFIHDELGHGIGYFGLSGLQIHLINAEQFGGKQSRVVNFNRGFAAARPEKGQKGLYLTRESLAEGVAGKIFPHVGSPNVVTKVTLSSSWLSSLALIDALSGGHSAKDAIDQVITHELGHGIGLRHPGEYKSVLKCMSTKVAVQGGVTSGNTLNVMRYHVAEYYQASDGKCYLYPEDSPWMEFIDSMKGTDINGGEDRVDENNMPQPVAGDASEQNTLWQNLTLTSDEPRS